MLQAINTKILIGIGALLLVIAGLLAHQRADAKRAADAAEKSAAILKQQQDEHQKAVDADAALWKKVEAEKAKHKNDHF